MASPFFGGPERQMLGLALELPHHYRTTFLSFSERGLCRPMLEEASANGFAAFELKHNFPDVRRAANEVASHLRRLRADVLCCSGYKPDLIGLLASRQTGVPVISVSHGWTAATLKVRFYETLDRLSLRWMDAIVCVSEGQAAKVRRAGAPADRVHVIRNAVSLEKFGKPDPSFRQELQSFFPAPKRRIVGAAGRLSPEKGFEKLIEAAALVVKNDADVGFVIFGQGPRRSALVELIAQRGLGDHVVLPGFRTNLEDYLPHFDLIALSSYTEGLPVVVLEAFAARVPVVGTAVGGVPEVIENGRSGYLVPAGDAAALADKIGQVLRDDDVRREMGQRGRQRMEEQFTFAAQSVQYQRLFEQLVDTPFRQGRRA
ncbi:MAG TPA: glycosyltransferase [Gemmataceae bacterium]|nr:glycosyltransferase [Gemmataceae bacterium]